VTDVGAKDRTGDIEETGAQLRELCAELLECEQADITDDDSLLSLGGNSLIATMLANRIEVTWGSRPSMEEMLICTIGELAEICAASRGQ
jgi:acyl carrier protein